MQRIPRIDEATAPAKTTGYLDAVKKQMGGVPNIIGTMAQSPAAFTRAFAARFGLPPTEYRRIASNDAHRPRRDAGHP